VEIARRALAFYQAVDQAELELHPTDRQEHGQLFLIPPDLMPEPPRDPASKPSAVTARTREIVHVQPAVHTAESDSFDSLNARLTDLGEIDSFIMRYEL
jgi:hypothetical protein